MAVFAVFYRFMNLGHKGSPVRGQLESALAGTGVSAVRSFQTNGTVLLRTTAAGAAKAVRRAEPTLAECSGYRDAAFIRPVAELTALLATQPFAAFSDERTYRETITLFDADASGWELPWTDPRDSLDLVAGGPGYVLGVIRKQGNAAGNPNGEAEKRTGAPATTRTVGTVERLCRAADKLE